MSSSSVTSSRSVPPKVDHGTRNDGTWEYLDLVDSRLPELALTIHPPLADIAKFIGGTVLKFLLLVVDLGGVQLLELSAYHHFCVQVCYIFDEWNSP